MKVDQTPTDLASVTSSRHVFINESSGAIRSSGRATAYSDTIGLVAVPMRTRENGFRVGDGTLGICRARTALVRMAHFTSRWLLRSIAAARAGNSPVGFIFECCGDNRGGLGCMMMP